MDISKIFAELGRLHLEVMQLREDLALAQKQISLVAQKATENQNPPAQA